MKKHLNTIVCLFLGVCVVVLGACKEEKPRTVLELFSEFQLLSQNRDFNISEDSLAQVEGLTCDGENLVVYDFHSGDSYTLFDVKSGEYIARFGTIGQGPAEIPAGCYGYLSKKCFFVFDDQTRMVMKYSLDSLRNKKESGAFIKLANYNVQDAKNSRLIAIDDSTFVSGGTYKTRYQYLLFDKNNKILDYGVDIYNVSDSAFNMYTKYLANQGDLVKHPKEKKFVYSVNFSSNMDFFEIKNDKIELIKSLRLGNPIYKPTTGQMGDNTFYSADLTEDSQVGYINLSATEKYVYALYSDKKLYANGRKSNTVLVFDWKGTPVKKYLLDNDAYYIAVDEIRQNMLVAVKNSEGGWRIDSYAL